MSKTFEERVAQEDAYDRGYDAGYYVGKRDGYKEAITIKHGHWIHEERYRDCEGDFYSKYKCSCCNFTLGGVYDRDDLTNFCGGCGADMREEK